MYVTLNFDVEDTVYPADAGIDAIPGWIAQTLTELGLRGTFHVIGDKARSMRQRGANPVIAAMTEHDIGIHTDSNNHPLVPELVQDAGWADGVATLVDYERRATQAIKEAFWKGPVATSRHAVFTSPHSFGAAAEMGLPYVYGWPHCPGHAGPVWYAGALVFPTRGQASPDGPSCYLSLGIEPALSHDDVFAQKMARLAEELDRRVATGIECLTLFLGHPVRIRSKGWTEDFLYANGRNRTVEELGFAYELKTPHLVDHAKRNFRRLCQYLRGREDCQVVGMARAAELFAPQPTHVSRDALFAYCTGGEEAGQPRLDPHFSPAELLTALCETLLAEDERGALPRAVERRPVIGPVDKPVLMPERPFVSRQEFLHLCTQLADHVRDSGHLPANATVEEDRVGISSLHAACVSSFVAACRGERAQRLRLERQPRYPAVAAAMDREMGWLEESSFFGPEFSAEKLRLHARLQTWSLKPARSTVGSGPYHEACGLVPHHLVSQR
ncbi:MAG: hypothetical protein ACLF0G_05420 [Candidatus Brocadiia bacterium]